MPADPVLCPAHDVPAAPEVAEPEDPTDLRTYPEAMAATRARVAAYSRIVAAYNAARARCHGDG